MSENQENEKNKSEESFVEWITSPQMIVSLSAVLLSVCGLFISMYEASLIREQQRASVWPNVEVGPSLGSDTLKIFVDNTGIGPARIKSASVIYKGEVKKNWPDLIRSFEFDEQDVSDYQSLINGRVLPPSSDEKELVFRVASTSQDMDQNLAYKLSNAIRNKRLNVKLCYCSVYDECWIASMKDVEKRFRGEQVPTREQRRVESCSESEASGI
jgi:hypothetical protein